MKQKEKTARQWVLELDRMCKKPLQILVVEDHPDTRTAIGMFLVSLGHEVRLACDADTALEQMIATEFDVLLTDVFLPGRTGWELVSELRGLDLLPPVTISMSAFFNPKEAESSRKYGCRAHLVKPFFPDRLAQVLEAAA